MKLYYAVVIAKDPDARIRLKQALSAMGVFEFVRLIGTIEEAGAAIEFAPQLDLVFLSDSFPPDDVQGFITRSRQTKKGKDAVYIVVKGREQNQLDVLLQVFAQGADGCLFEPYSVDNLTALIDAANGTRSVALDVREGHCLRAILRAVADEVDRLSLAAQAGLPPKYSRQYRMLSATLAEWHSRSPAEYSEQLLELFLNAPLPTISTKLYKGASERVRRMTEQKLQEELLGESNRSKNKK